MNAKCQPPGIRTDEPSDQRCAACCKDDGAHAGTVFGYGTCKCFETRMEPRK